MGPPIVITATSTAKTRRELRRLFGSNGEVRAALMERPLVLSPESQRQLIAADAKRQRRAERNRTVAR